MKSVLISIRPEWCAKIASGEKTIEVRKTVPKLETPFKCYIYETQGKTEIPWMDEDGHMIFRGRGMVIGEFVCDKIFDICIEISKLDDLLGYPFPGTGLTDKEIVKYLRNGKTGFGWHISDLVIYEKPKPLCGFFAYCDRCDKRPISCKFAYEESNENGYYSECMCDFKRPIERPPQSWCYVDGRKEDE